MIVHSITSELINDFKFCGYYLAGYDIWLSIILIRIKINYLIYWFYFTAKSINTNLAKHTYYWR